VLDLGGAGRRELRADRDPLAIPGCRLLGRRCVCLGRPGGGGLRGLRCGRGGGRLLGSGRGGHVHGRRNFGLGRFGRRGRIGGGGKGRLGLRGRNGLLPHGRGGCDFGVHGRVGLRCGRFLGRCAGRTGELGRLDLLRCNAGILDQQRHPVAGAGGERGSAEEESREGRGKRDARCSRARPRHGRRRALRNRLEHRRSQHGRRLGLLSKDGDRGENERSGRQKEAVRTSLPLWHETQLLTSS
jgi:hypothetical protein